MTQPYMYSGTGNTKCWYRGQYSKCAALLLTASPQPPVKRGVKNNTNYTLKFKGKAAWEIDQEVMGKIREKH